MFKELVAMTVVCLFGFWIGCHWSVGYSVFWSLYWLGAILFEYVLPGAPIRSIAAICTKLASSKRQVLLRLTPVVAVWGGFASFYSFR